MTAWTSVPEGFGRRFDDIIRATMQCVEITPYAPSGPKPWEDWRKKEAAESIMRTNGFPNVTVYNVVHSSVFKGARHMWHAFMSSPFSEVKEGEQEKYTAFRETVVQTDDPFVVVASSNLIHVTL